MTDYLEKVSSSELFRTLLREKLKDEKITKKGKSWVKILVHSGIWTRVLLGKLEIQSNTLPTDLLKQRYNVDNIFRIDSKYSLCQMN